MLTAYSKQPEGQQCVADLPSNTERADRIAPVENRRDNHVLARQQLKPRPPKIAVAHMGSMIRQTGGLLGPCPAIRVRRLHSSRHGSPCGRLYVATYQKQPVADDAGRESGAC